MVSLLDTEFEDAEVYLVFEYISLDLRKYLESVRKLQGGGLERSLVQKYTSQILQGLQFCHM